MTLLRFLNKDGFLSFPFLLVSFVWRTLNLPSVYVLIINATNYIINSLKNTIAPLFRKQRHSYPNYFSIVCQHNLWLMERQSTLVSSPEIGWSWLAAPFFSYGNNLEGQLAPAPRWPYNSKCSVISVHRFTYLQNMGKKRIWRCWPFLIELLECRALPEALTLIYHKALLICPAYVKHKHLFRQLKQHTDWKSRIWVSTSKHTFGLPPRWKLIWKLTRRCTVFPGLSSLKTLLSSVTF